MEVNSRVRFSCFEFIDQYGSLGFRLQSRDSARWIGKSARTNGNLIRVFLVEYVFECNFIPFHLVRLVLSSRLAAASPESKQPTIAFSH